MKKQMCPHCQRWLNVGDVQTNTLIVCPHCQTQSMVVEKKNVKLNRLFGFLRVVLAIITVCLFALKVTPHSYIALGLLVTSIVFEENCLSQSDVLKLEEVIG